MTVSAQQATHRRSAAGPIHWLFFAVVAWLAILVDQATKAYVVAHLDRHATWMPVDFVEPVFRFTHVRNTGAAFGMFPQGGTLFLVVAIVVSTVIVYYYRNLPFGGWVVRLALALQFAGALGNVIDRVRLGYVVDFMKVTYWPVFNVADSCIVIGVLLLAFEMLREEWRAGRQRENAADDGDESTASPPQSRFMTE